MKKFTFSKHFRLDLTSVSTNVFFSFCCFMMLLAGQSMTAQTILINPNAEGGFENGATFADNGWTTVAASANTWNVGTAPGWFTGTGGAYVSNDSGAGWTYTTNVVNSSSFYRDITFPVGSTSVSLSFDWRGNGNDGNYDNLLVYLVDTTVTPNTSGPIGTNTTTTGWTGYTNGTTGYYLLQRNGTSVPTTTTNVTFSLTAAQLAYVSNKTKRLVFVWKNDGSGGTNPPASVDNISLTAVVPTCFPVTALTVASFTNSSAVINWTAPIVAPSEGFEYEIRTSGAAGSGATGLAFSGALAAGALTHNPGGLTADTAYTYHIRSGCGAGDFSAWTSVSFFTGYCLPSSTSSESYIKSFSTTGGTTNISNLLSGYTTGGYQNNYATATVSQYATGTINFSTQIVGPTVGTAIWVDWNNDFVFDNATERVFVTTDYGDDQTGSFIVPSGTALGDYRMRVRIDYNSSSPSACSNANLRTEAEDYKLTVITQPSCLPPSTLTAAANNAFTATLNWTASTSSPTSGYDFYVTNSTTLPTSATTPTGSVNAGVLTTTVASLTPMTFYYAYVRSNCGSGDTSIWTPLVSFMTPCDPSLITGTTPASVCGQGTANLGATANEGTIKWYAAATGGSVLGTGNTFTTPSISTTTPYFAENVVAGTAQTSGKAAPAAAATGSTSTSYGIVFNAAQPVELKSVSVYSATAGTINVKITNAAATEIYATGNIPVIAGGTTTPNIIPLNFIVPAGSGYRILLKAYSGASLIRDTSPVAFPYNGTDNILNVVSSEWGGTTKNNYFYFYDVKYNTVCISPRTEVVATVTTPPALTLSTNSTAAVCSGQSSAAVSIATGGTDYDTYVWSPATNVSGNATAGWTFNPSSTTTYTLTASQSSGALCQATATLTVNVNQNPPVNVAPTATICEGASATLTAFTSAPGTVALGAATTLTSNTVQPTAFCNRWKQYWNQTVYTAAELQAAGLRAGNITSIAYNITTLGDGTNVTGFEIRIGTTTNATTTAFVTTGLSQVYGPATYTHAVGVNTINFTTPYVWDGVSNIIVDVRQLGADNTYNSITYYTGTTSNMTISATTSTLPSVNTLQTLVANASVTPSTSLQRLNVVFGGQVDSTGAGTLNWEWNPGALTGNSVTVSPTGTTTYTVKATNSATGCIKEATVAVTVNLAPAPTGNGTQTFEVFNASEATVANLVAVGNNIVWFATLENALDNVNPLASTTELVNGENYFAMQTTTAGCRSIFPLEVAVSVTLGNSSFDLKGLKFYPNPVTNILNLEYTGTITGVEVFNMLGQKIASKNVNEIATTVDMSNLANGSYFVKVKAENGSRTIKVMKN